MNIFVTNDDGIDAEGLINLVSALSEVADVYVGAPNEQKSASGHGITLGRPISVEEVSFANARKAFCIAGTPVDCVKIGLDLFQKEGIVFDKTFSGINHGSNIGTDTLYSGTVAAAIEGMLSGIPSVAISLNSRRPKYFEATREMAVKLAMLDFGTIEKNMVLNVNLPHLPTDEIKGVKIIGLGYREYDDWCQKKIGDDGSIGYEYAGKPIHDDKLDSDTNDVGAFQEGYATITPLQYDLTNYNLIEKVKNAGLLEL